MADQVLTIHLEVKKEDRTYVFLVPMGSPIGQAYDACHEVLQELSKMANDAVEKSKQGVDPEIVTDRASSN